MTVEELIKELQQFEPNKKVEFCYDEEWLHIKPIQEYNQNTIEIILYS